MARFVDLSHTLADGMPGVPRMRPDGSWGEATVSLKVVRTREESAQTLRDGASFESTDVAFPTPIATYIDAPYCRWPEMRDIAGLALDDVILPGVVVDCRGTPDRAAVAVERLPATSLAGLAVLFHFGWDAYWATPRYRDHPHIGADILDRLIAEGAKLAGFDTGSADAVGDLAFPVHSRLLAKDILIVENLTGLEALAGRPFRFFAVPVKAAKATSMTIRAFAERL
ncbi:MAG: cyclase family protein [Alphaproteobacteria bacterium]